jgi:hypothetical protein
MQGRNIMSNETPLSPEEKPLPEANRVDPNGPPRPEKASGGARSAVTVVGCLAVGGILFSMCGIQSGRTAGAMRSSRLEWEQRERQIDEAQQKDQNIGGDAKSNPSPDRDAAHE